MFALASAALVIASLVAIAVSFANTDFNTGHGPEWTTWLAYGAFAGFCVGCLGLIWALASWLWTLL